MTAVYKRSRLFAAFSMILVFAIAIAGCTGAVMDNENTTSALNEPAIVSEPQVQESELSATPAETESPQALISSYSVDNSKRAYSVRVFNIEKALGILDGYVIRPGEKMSLNKVLGERNRENGWRTTPDVLDADRYIDRYGEGLYAVSSALYNAAIRAELTIFQVKHFDAESGYIPPALESKISNDGTDLVIANPFGSDITIKAGMNNNIIVVEIYGPPLGYTVDFFSKKTAETALPPQIYIYKAAAAPDGMQIEEGKSFTWSKSRKGVTYEVYKTIYKPGESGTGTTSLYEVYTYPAIQGYTYVNLPGPAASD